jgi:cytochrome c oxidase subunit 6b
MSNNASFFKTTTPDRVHFPATNQSHFCWQKYNEFVLCVKKNSGDDSACVAQKQAYASICPEDWVESWNEQRSAGTFLGVQEKETATSGHH